MKWLLGFLGMVGAIMAGPTESRTWTATNGKTVEGRILRIKGDRVVLGRADGPEVTVPLSTFIEEDRRVIEEHFGAAPAGTVSGSGAAPAEGLPHEQGKVVGPIQAAEGASYYLYLPKSLKADRKAPLLFYTHSGGGRPDLIGSLAEGAEMGGWIMAISVESKNGNEEDVNMAACRGAVEHLIETLPVATDRIYYTGNSGGAARAMINATELPAGGGMPNIGYIPRGYDPKRGFYYVISGGSDYNRYLSAHIAERFGKNAVHRMNPGGHADAAAWQMIDGMFWLNARFLGSKRRDHPEEAEDFEANAIGWLRQLSGSEPHRAYSNARILKDDYRVSGESLAAVNRLIGELEKKRENVLYHEGLEDIDDLSEDDFAAFGKDGGSQFNHLDPKVARKVEKLLEKYRGVPVIEGTLNAMAGPTAGR